VLSNRHKEDTVDLAERMQDELTARIAAALREWETGRSTSPSTLDYVIDADRVLTAHLPDYIGSTDEGREFVADALYEDAGETYVTVEDIARHLVEVLTAE
jgi:hypothetical protein